MDQNQKPLFVIDPKPVVDWPVIVKLPADGGTFAEYQFTAKIRVLSPAEYTALASAIKSSTAEPIEGADKVSATPGMQDLLKENVRQFATLVVGWDGPVDSFGNPVPFTPALLEEQVTGPRGVELSAGLWTAISEIRRGERLKNSAPPSDVG